MYAFIHDLMNKIKDPFFSFGFNWIMVYLMAWHLRKLQARIKDLEDEKAEQANEVGP